MKDLSTKEGVAAYWVSKGCDLYMDESALETAAYLARAVRLAQAFDALPRCECTMVEEWCDGCQPMDILSAAAEGEKR